MGMAADQLFPAVAGDRGEVAGPPLLEQQGEEVDLEEDVAELVEQLGVIVLLDRVGKLVGLLDRMRDDRALVLLAVPGALAAQPPGDLVEERDRFAAAPSGAGFGFAQGATPGGTPGRAPGSGCWLGGASPAGRGRWGSC
jgi:hypothetical protein